MPTIPYSPEEARQILALRQRQEEARRQSNAELDNLVGGIVEARVEMEKALQTYMQRCDELRTMSRRRALDETTAGYRTFVAMQMRLGGAMSQALKRAETGNRLLESARTEREERVRREEQDRLRLEARQSQRRVEQSLLPTHDDFESLYGEFDNEEDVSYA